MVLMNMTYVMAHQITSPISPVTLNDHWSRLGRLILLAALASIGSIGNVFMISAVMIEDFLRKRGNCSPNIYTAILFIKIGILYN